MAAVEGAVEGISTLDVKLVLETLSSPLIAAAHTSGASARPSLLPIEFPYLLA